MDYEIFKFLDDCQIGGLICIAVPNLTKIGQIVVEISYLMFFKMAAVRHLEIFKLIFKIFLMVQMANVHQHAKFRQNWSNGG